jgi:hypothetical protein
VLDAFIYHQTTGVQALAIDQQEARSEEDATADMTLYLNQWEEKWGGSSNWKPKI